MKRWLLATCTFLMCVIAPWAHGQCAERWLLGESQGRPGFDGDVGALAYWDPDGDGEEPPRLIAGGNFRYFGRTELSGIAQWDGSSWSAIGAGLNTSVLTLAVYRGELIAGGTFSIGGDTNASYLARWNGSAWVAFPSEPNKPVYGLCVVGDDLYVGGSFTKAGNVAASMVGRWDGTAWHDLGGGITSNGAPYSRVGALTMFEGKLIAGGYFTKAGSTSVNSVAAWDGVSWSRLADGVEHGEVFAVRVVGGELFVGGSFWTSGFPYLNRIARWNGTAWNSVGDGLFGDVFSIGELEGDLVVGGTFVESDENNVTGMARLIGNQWAPLGTGLVGSDHNAYAMLSDEGGLVVGGHFYGAGDVAAGSLARWDGTRWGSFNSGGIDGPVRAIAVHDGEVVLGGGFHSAGSVQANSVVSWTGTTWRGLGSGVGGGLVHVLGHYSGELVAGGDFDSVEGFAGRGIAAWNGSAWRALGGGIDGYGLIRAFAVHKGELFAGGVFSQIGGIPAGNLARWDGSSWHSMDTTAPVYAMTLYRGNLIVSTGARLSSWNGESWNDITPTTSGWPMFLALAEYRGNLFAGGYTSHFESVQYPYLQQFDGVSWSNPGAGIWTYSPYSDHKVLMLTQAFGKLFVGGQFELAGDQYVDNLATWDGAAWKEVGGGVGGNVMAGREYGAEFIVGGNMQLVGGYPNAQRSYFWSRWTVGGEPWIAEQPQGVEFEAGMSVDASVLAAEGYDIDASYAWMHDGRLISDGPGGIAPGGGMVEGSSSAHLSIKGAQAVDAGDFACVVSNDCGQSTSWTAWIRTPCAADHDRSGFLDRDDFDEFVSDFEAGDPAADFDRSGFVDADDFEAFVASYLQGCS